MKDHALAPTPIDGETGGSILLVDDDADLREALNLRLSEAGYRCVCADCGDRALYEWRSRSFDLVITDLRMPGLDGCELAEALCESEAVPIIVITGFKREFRLQLQCIENITVLEKPVDPAMLVNLVAAVLAGRTTGEDGVRLSARR